MFEEKTHHVTTIKIRVEKKIVIVVCKNCERAKTICWINSLFARCASCANNDKFVDQCDVNRDEYDEMNERKQKIIMSSIKKRARKFFSFFSSTSFSIFSSLKSKFRKKWMMFNLDLKCLFAKQFKIKSRKKNWCIN
jgi:bisphosphoglycerate-independent phosphoglycerate mutase (AlkP superfamily)